MIHNDGTSLTENINKMQVFLQSDIRYLQSCESGWQKDSTTVTGNVMAHHSMSTIIDIIIIIITLPVITSKSEQT